MSAPPRPKNEAERLALLQSYGILDTEPEPAFDDIARLASLICNAPIALVSLVDDQRQWFKARVGLTEPETSRDASFCAHAIVTPQQPLIVNDTFTDLRFADNPLVTGYPNIRFYAGIPLMLEGGYAAGTLCVIDHTPRELSQAQIESLHLLARQVTGELHRRKRAQARRGAANSWDNPSEPVQTAAIAVGTIAGRYRVEEVLGVGGMGLVVGAVDLANSSAVAIKFILPGVSGHEVTARFVREARALIRLRSPHVTEILDVGNLGNGAPFIVMERLEGEDLDAVIESGAPLRFSEAIDYLLQACAGVAFIHAAGFLHRDLKPSNLFLTRRPGATPQVKLLDFGIAKLWRSLDSNVPDGSTELTLAGSPHYMAPEQMTKGATLDVRCDIWSLGVVLYELLVFHRPFDGPSPIEVCINVINEPFVPLSKRRKGVSPVLERIIERCLAKDPAARYGSVTELADALRAFRSDTRACR